MKSIHFKLWLALWISVGFSLSGLAQNDSIYIHSKGKIVFSEALDKIDSVTFTRPDSVPAPVVPGKEYKVLVMEVDYITHQFERGSELTFEVPVDSLPIVTDYVSPADFGSIRFYYPQIEKELFAGTIVWNGQGEITYPVEWKGAEDFLITDTEDLVTPGKGFECLYNPGIKEDNYFLAWCSIQRVIQVRDFLKSNPLRKVNYYLYTPRVGVIDPNVAKWIFFIYN